MKKFLSALHIAIIALLLSACGGGSKTSSASFQAEIIPLKHAENLTLLKGEGYIEARLRNPWDTTAMLRTYILVDKDQEVPEQLPKGTLVRTPLSKTIIYSGVHCSLLDQLDATASIAGVCDLNYIHTPNVQKGVHEGRIMDAGSSLNPDVERIIDLHPDGILLCPFENSGGFGRIGKLNVPIIECAEAILMALR